VVGLSSGLFVAAAAEANERDPKISSTTWLVLVTAIVVGVLFYAGFSVLQRNHATAAQEVPAWLYGVYAVVWILGLIAALLALFGDGGFKVAVLAIVPLVLLAPTALQGIRMTRSHASA